MPGLDDEFLGLDAEEDAPSGVPAAGRANGTRQLQDSLQRGRPPPSLASSGRAAQRPAVRDIEDEYENLIGNSSSGRAGLPPPAFQRDSAMPSTRNDADPEFPAASSGGTAPAGRPTPAGGSVTFRPAAYGLVDEDDLDDIIGRDGRQDAAAAGRSRFGVDDTAKRPNVGGVPRQAYPQGLGEEDEDVGNRSGGSGGGADVSRPSDQASARSRLAGRHVGSRTVPAAYDRMADRMTRRPLTAPEAATIIQSHYRGYRTRRQMGRLPHQRRAAAQHRRGAAPLRHGDYDPQGQPMKGPPIIDINKLPRYGVLAPPYEKPPPQAGLYWEFDRQTNTFIKNKGVLREALEQRTGWQENAPIRTWSDFALRQKQRYVPISPDANRRVLPESRGYRLRIMRVVDLPLHTTFDGRTLEFQLGVSLYDEAYGTFYGNTCYSMSDGYDRHRAAQRNAIDLDFSFDVYFHSPVSDPRCMAVVEIIMLERMPDGVVKGQYSLGWALLPLFRVVGTPAMAGVSLPPDVHIDTVPGKPMSVALVSGTPRYLLLRNVYNEDLRAPKVVPNCSITFQAELYSASEMYVPLLPENFLVTYSDVVPGLRRFDPAGQLSIGIKNVISTLASPMPSPTYSVVLRRLQLALPLRVHDLLQTLDPKNAPPTSRRPHPEQFMHVQHESPALTYTIRIAVHNGRSFVGPAYELNQLTILDVPGWKVLQVPAPDAVFDYVMGDVLTTIVVELLAAPPQPMYNGEPLVQYLVGWTAFVPFSYINEDGGEAEVAVGIHRYPLQAKRGLLLRDQPPLNWRALMGDMMTQEVPEPMVEFQLFETGRTPILPPLQSKFAVIQQQRDEEASMGELSLDQLLAPVEVPEELDLNARGGSVGMSEGLEQFRQDSESEGRPEAVLSPPGSESPIVRERSQALASLMQSQQAGLATDALRDIQAAMQRQLELLFRAVTDLKEERKSLRNSIILAGDGPQRDDVLMDNAGSVQGFYNRLQKSRASLDPNGDELRRFKDMPPTSDFGGVAAFAGAQAPDGRGAPGTLPSRMLLQQLHDAGMVDSLPAEVQAMLRRKGPPRALSFTPVDLTLEARDPRLASDIIVQLLAYRHHDTLNAPANLQAMYFTFQFYHFAPTATEMAFLVAAEGTEDMAATRILLSNSPHRRGAGLVLKYVVDGGADPVSTGQAPEQAAYDQAMHFAQYLAHKRLNIDVWDGDALLQVGSAAVDLQPLLRQGREFSELLVEVPILDQSAVAPDMQGKDFASHSALSPGINDTRVPTIISKGSLIVRLINIGRESTAVPAAADDAHGHPKKKRVRVRPAWEVPKTYIAQELAGRVDEDGQIVPATIERLGRDATALEYDQYGRPSPHKSQRDGAGGVGKFLGYGVDGDAAVAEEMQRRSQLRPLDEPQPSYGLGRVAPNRDDLLEQDDIKLTILEKTNRKCARVRQLQQIKEVDDDIPQHAPPPGNSREDQYRRLQKQLLLDVHSARGRHKDDFIREQLRRAMLVRRVVRPGYGEVVVYEHEFGNPYSVEQVFEVRISHPTEVSVLSKTEEYRALRAANARFFGNLSQPAGPLEQEVMAGNRLYLHPNERITLPLKIQSFEPPPGYINPGQRPSEAGNEQGTFNRKTAADAEAKTREEREAALGHVVVIELFSIRNQHAVAVVELQLVPRPLIIDRTFRFFGGENELMRQTIRMKNLPGADVTFAGGRLKQLAVAASHKDVIAGVGSTGLAGGSERDELYLKYKTGAAPGVEQFYVLVYLDRLLARPVEVWQVFVHALRKVDMRAMIGQTSQASVVVRGAATSRRVHCYASHPDELQVSPDQFVLVAGSLTEVMLNYRPVAHGRQDIKVHLVDVETRELVYALIVSTEGTGPLISRTFEIELPAGTVANKKITYTNPYQQFRVFMLRSNQPWLMSFTPARLQLPPGATRPLGLTFDARAATTGVVDALVFVNDEDDKTEECFKVRVRIYR